MAQPNEPIHLTLTEGDRDLLIASRREQLVQQRAEAERKEGARLARRILIAGLLITLTAVASFAVLPSMGVTIPITVPLVAFVAIAAGALMTGKAEGILPDPDAGARHGCDPARPAGCCGPQPLRVRRPDQ